MTIRSIAGHSFPDFGNCICGMSWLVLRQTQRSEIGLPNIAHTANLTEHEYNQIEAARDAEDARISAATAELSG